MCHAPVKNFRDGVISTVLLATLIWTMISFAAKTKEKSPNGFLITINKDEKMATFLFNTQFY